MVPVDGFLDALFLGMFCFGLIFTIGSLVLGAADLGGHDVGGVDQGGHGGQSADHDHDWPVVNLSVILAFVAWFGGVGYLASQGAGWSVALSLAAALVGGLAGGYLVYLVYSRVIRPGQQAPLDPRDYQLDGMMARVTSSIRAGGVGEIVYEQAGTRQVAAARSTTGSAIPRGAEVVVLKVERGTALVERWDVLMDGGAPELKPLQIDASPPSLPQDERARAVAP